MRFKTNLRKLTCLLLLSMAGVSAMAADYVHVKVSDVDGTATFFALADKPVVSFTSDFLVLTTKKQTVQYPIADYRKIEFTEATGITSVDASSKTGIFTIGSSLKGEQLPAGRKVTVYAVNGEVIGSATASQCGTVEIPLNGKSGIFIVKTYSKTFKFIVK